MDSPALHCGWLIKSPPLSQTGQRPPILKARWRRRWFVLQCGQFPGQFILNYYTEETQRKLKGSICLDECEQVDIGLTVKNGKQRYEHIFKIKTPQRIFYLAADTLDEMNSWAKIVCEACGLRASPDDESEADAGFSIADLNATHAPRTVATASVGPDNPLISSPYIHISTCHSGGLPKRIQSSMRSSPSRGRTISTRTDVSSLELGDDSVFYPSEDPPISPNELSERLQTTLVPPSRPPKPPHLLSRLVAKSHSPLPPPDNYANSGEMQKFYQTEIAPPGSNTLVRSRFKSDPVAGDETNNNRTQDSKGFTGILRDQKPPRTSFGKFATLGSSQTKNRGLNHKSQTAPSEFATLKPSFRAPPVQRSLKPPIAASEMNLTQSVSARPIHGRSRSTSEAPTRVDPQPSMSTRTLPRSYNSMADDSSDEASNSEETDGYRGMFEEPFHQNRLRPYPDQEEEQIYFYLPSFESQGTLNNLGGGQKFMTMIPAEQYERSPVAYIDLDLPTRGESHSMKHPGPLSAGLGPGSAGGGGFSPLLPPTSSDDSSTAYKKIDFLKTEAFNRTRHFREEIYAQEQEQTEQQQ